MGPAQAVVTCLRKSASFSGYASRSEFWWFAPFGIALPACSAGVVTSMIGKQPEQVFWPLLATTISAVPFLAAGSRRLQDAGMPGQEILIPFLPVFFGCVFWISMKFGLLATAYSFLIAPYIGMLLVLLFFVFIAFGGAICVLLTAFLLGPTIGHLILPSIHAQPNSSLNPKEVPQ